MRIILAIAAIATLTLTGCAGSRPAAVNGCCYTDVKSDIADSVTAHVGASKVGTSKASGILGLVATGDASITAAAKSAGITKINYVDYHVKNILGFYVEYTTFVYGE